MTDEFFRLGPLLDPADHELLPLQPRRIVPWGLFGGWAAWVAAALALFAAAWRRSGWDARAVIGLAGLGLCAPWFYLVSLTSGIEHPRHAIPVAVALRIACLVLAIVSWDRLTDRSSVAG